MAILCKSIQTLFYDNFTKLVTATIIAIVYYIGTGILFKSEELREIINIIKRRY